MRDEMDWKRTVTVWIAIAGAVCAITQLATCDRHNYAMRQEAYAVCIIAVRDPLACQYAR